jgi:hypothetical protein
MEALKELGATASTKYVIPLELTDLAKRLGHFLDQGLTEGEGVRRAAVGQGAVDADTTTPA